MPHTRRTTAPAARACLLLALLVGLVGMHGLGPVAPWTGAQAQAAHAASSAPDHGDPPRTGGHPATSDDCHHHAGTGTGGGHADHADQTCAAPGVSGPPALPVLVADGIQDAAADGGLPAWSAVSDVARAPPSLAELQLLRI